jgi:hypothetical protein
LGSTSDPGAAPRTQQLWFKRPADQQWTQSIAATELGHDRYYPGLCPYVASLRGGTRPSESYVDVILLNGDAAAYPNGPNYYVRIPKATFLAIP